MSTCFQLKYAFFYNYLSNESIKIVMVDYRFDIKFRDNTFPWLFVINDESIITPRHPQVSLRNTIFPPSKVSRLVGKSAHFILKYVIIIMTKRLPRAIQNASLMNWSSHNTQYKPLLSLKESVPVANRKLSSLLRETFGTFVFVNGLRKKLESVTVIWHLN